MKKLVCILSCLYVVNYSAQNYRDDLLAMNHNLLGRESYSLQLCYKLFVDDKMTHPFQQRDVSIARDGEKLHVRQSSGIEIIETENTQLLFDHKQKVFSARKKESSEGSSIAGKKELAGLFGTYVDSLMNVFEHIKLVYEDAGVVKYECKPKPGNEAAMIWLEMDKKLKVYRSVTTQYKEKRKISELDNREHQITVKVEYKGFTSHPVLSPSLFEIKNYVMVRDQSITGPSKKYSDYKCLNAAY